MGLATSLKKASSKALKKFGGNVTIKRTTASSYNVDTGNFVNTETSVTVKGFLENVKKIQVNDLIAQDDKKLTISAQDITFVPTTKDTVVISGISYKIIQIDFEQQNNISIFYEIYLRA